MATKRRRRRHKRKSNPGRKRRHHRRASMAHMFKPKRRRHRRRRNPGFGGAAKNVGSTLIGVVVGGIAGAGANYALDKIGIGSSLVRGVGLIAGGVASALVIGSFSPGAGGGVGASMAGMGISKLISGDASSPAASALRALRAAPKKRSIKGLGSGDGMDMEGAFEQVGDPDNIDYVEGPDDEMGYVEGPDDDMGYVEGADDDVGDPEMDGAYETV